MIAVIGLGLLEHYLLQPRQGAQTRTPIELQGNECGALGLAPQLSEIVGLESAARTCLAQAE